MSANLEQDIQAFFSGLGDLLTFCETKSTSCCIGDAEFCIEGISVAILTLQYIVDGIPTTEQDLLSTLHVLTGCFHDLKSTWNSVLMTANASRPSPVLEAGQVCRTGQPGRPSSYIDPNQITFLFQQGFKFNQISDMYLVHRTTLWRRLRTRGIQLTKFTHISDVDLAEVISNIQHYHPNTGVSMMQGHLRSVGIVVQERKVRSILRTTEHSAQRCRNVAVRRSYSVPGPNALWHIDGHHKLIRWKLVTHGGIDGFSRVIVFLHCSDNNKSETVLRLFVEAVEKFSLPSRVRADRGSENFGVANYMEMRRGINRGSFIAGQSIHNCRIERLWRDVFYSVIQSFYSLFYELESQDLLDIESEVDMFCLHYIYLPRINSALEQFADAYNHHGMRTEHNWSPYQMWINGMISADRTNAVANLSEYSLTSQELETFGVDPQETLPLESVDEDIQFERNAVSVISEDIVRCLTAEINPLCISNNMGIDLYCRARDLIISYLQ